MKILTILTTGLCACVLSFGSVSAVGQAIDWTGFGSGTVSPFSVETRSNGLFSYQLSNLSSGAASFSPDTFGTMMGGPPISNNVDFPAMGSSTTGVYGIRLFKDALDTGPVIGMNEYFFIGGLDANNIINIDFFDTVGGTNMNASMTISPAPNPPATSYPVSGGVLDGSNTLLWTTGDPGSITVTAGGKSGALFFQNTTGSTINEIILTRTSGTGGMYIGVTTPEPSTYLAMAGGLGVLCLLAARRRAKAKA